MMEGRKQKAEGKERMGNTFIVDVKEVKMEMTTEKSDKKE